MRRVLTVVLFVLCFLTSCRKESITHLVICQTTDIHGAYFDSLYTGGVANSTSLANVSTYLKNLRSEGIRPIMIDCGDNVQGDLAAYYYNYKDVKSKHLFLQMADYLNYDALVVGNHDIEAGHGVYDRFKKQRRIPYLAANAVIDDGSEDSGEPYFKEYTIVRRKGVKVAVIGMTNANIKSWLSENQWSGIDFLKISDIAQAEVDKVVEKTNPDLVVLAIHSGTGEENDDIENCGKFLASSLKDVDIIFAGHDHSPFAELVPNPNGDIVLVNASDRCSNVGRCDVYFKKQRGKIVDKTVSQVLVPMKDIAVDEDFIAKFKRHFLEVKDFATAEVGELTADINFEDALKGPSSYVSLIHTVQLDRSNADISIAAPLSSQGTIKAGTMSYQDLSAIYKYENQMYVVELTGKQIKDYLEYSYDLWINREGPFYNYDSADGIRYNVYVDNPYGERVSILSMNDGSSFRYDKTYSVAMTSYRASGGGDLLVKGANVQPSSLKIIDSYTDIRTLIYEYFVEQGSVNPTVSTNWKFVH